MTDHNEMTDRNAMYEGFLDDLGPIVDGDAAALERHADFLAEDDEARDERFEAAEAAALLRDAGADYVVPFDLEARVLAALDQGDVQPQAQGDAQAQGDLGTEAGSREQAGDASEGRTTSPGFATHSPARHAPFDAASIPATPIPAMSIASMSTPSSAIPTTPIPGEAGSAHVTGELSSPAMGQLPAGGVVPSTLGGAGGWGPPAPVPGAMQSSSPVAPTAAMISSPGSQPGYGYASSPAGQPGYGTQPLGTVSMSSPGAVSVPGAISTPGTQRPLAAPAEKPAGKMGKLLFFPILGALGLAAAAAIAFVIVGPSVRGGEDAPPSPTLATHGIDGTLETVDRASSDGQSGVSIRRAAASSAAAGEAGFVALAAGQPVPAGATLRTDERTRARVTLADGSVLVLNHATELELVGESPRSFRLREGEVVAEVAHLENAPNASFETPTGRVEVLGTKFVLTANSDVTSVRVARGVVAVHGATGATASSGGAAAPATEVRAGEEGLVRRGAAPTVTAVTALASQMAWSELGAREAEGPETEEAIPGIGSLRARRPGEQQARERPLALARHDVRVRIVGNVARTEIEEVFRNDSDQVLEGVYRFPLPADAQIARLALDVEGRMEEGAFVERDRAARIWRGVIRNATAVHERQRQEEFIWVPGPWHDPAILEWQRGGQFELRIFPIPAHGERRVVLAYTQNVQPQGARRRYVYPLAHSADDSTRVGQFNVDVRVAGAERVEASGYRVTSAAEADATRLTFAEQSFSPKGDLVIDYELPGGEREVRFWTYRGAAATPPPADSRDEDREVLDAQRMLSVDTRPYVAFALRPELPRARERRTRDLVFVVDASQSMVGERYQRASQLTTQIVREMDRRDRFTVLACDYQCRALPGGLQPPSVEAAVTAAEWLEGIEPAGASDLVAALREAAATVSAERREGQELHLVYVGDGVSTTGYRRAASLAAETRQLAQAERVTVDTVGIGGDADTVALRALARSSGGHYVAYVPGQRSAVAAATVLETTYGASLESPRVELPAGLSDSAPTEIATLRAGQEVIVVARMDRDRVQGDLTLRGTVAGQPFERRYPVELVPTESAGNRFVPSLWAAERIELLQLGGRGEDRAKIIAMSKAFGVLSRHTSLLVLESEAMFRAFRVDRAEATQQWTGEEDLVGGEAGPQEPGADPALVGALANADGVGDRGAETRMARSGPSAPPPAARMGSTMGGGGGSATAGAGGLRGGGAGRGAGEATSGADMDDAVAAQRAPRAESEASAPSEVANPWGWRDMPAPTGVAQTTTATPIMPEPSRPRGRGGQWMERRTFRVGEVTRGGEPTSAEERLADQAEAALRELPDSRDRHREAVRRLAQAGRLDRALEVAEAWVARDREDAEALTAKADLLGRMGERNEALRLLTGTVDLTADSEALHQRLASAFDRMGRPERACAHRIALAEIDESDANAVAAAMRCERSLGRAEAAERVLGSIRDASVRRRAEAAAAAAPTPRGFGGDFTVDATWSGGSDLDVTILTPQGTRLSWMGGRTTVVGEDASSTARERLGLRTTAPGTYVIEVSRTDPTDTRPIEGRLAIRAVDARQTVPFTLRDARTAVARVRVTRETRLVPVTGTVAPF